MLLLTAWRKDKFLSLITFLAIGMQDGGWSVWISLNGAIALLISTIKTWLTAESQYCASSRFILSLSVAQSRN